MAILSAEAYAQALFYAHDAMLDYGDSKRSDQVSKKGIPLV